MLTSLFFLSIVFCFFVLDFLKSCFSEHTYSITVYIFISYQPDHIKFYFTKLCQVTSLFCVVVLNYIILILKLYCQVIAMFPLHHIISCSDIV